MLSAYTVLEVDKYLSCLDDFYTLPLSILKLSKTE